MNTEKTNKLNSFYKFASLYVDVVYKPNYKRLGKVFGKDIGKVAKTLASMNDFPGKITIDGVDITYDDIDVVFKKKAIPLPGTIVEIKQDLRSFSVYPAGLYGKNK